jgi:hypothetical protein
MNHKNMFLLFFFWDATLYRLVGKYKRFGKHIVSISILEGEDSMFLRNVCVYLWDCTGLNPHRHSHRRENHKFQMFVLTWHKFVYNSMLFTKTFMKKRLLFVRFV